MDNLSLLMDGFGSVLTPQNLLFACIGVLLGTFVGVLPGIGPAMAVALLLPVTYGLDPIGAFIMFAGIYYGGMYGGSTTSILLNTPGESASVMTALEGNLMARAGRASQALATAAIGSFIAGTIGTLLVVFFAPALASVAVEIGAPSYFALMVLAMIMVSSAPLATATSAMALNNQSGTPTPAADTTDSSGPDDSDNFSGDSAVALAMPTSAYSTPAVISAPKSAAG